MHGLLNSALFVHFNDALHVIDVYGRESKEFFSLSVQED